MCFRYRVVKMIGLHFFCPTTINARDWQGICQLSSDELLIPISVWYGAVKPVLRIRTIFDRIRLLKTSGSWPKQIFGLIYSGIFWLKYALKGIYQPDTNATEIHQVFVAFTYSKEVGMESFSKARIRIKIRNTGWSTIYRHSVQLSLGYKFFLNFLRRKT
jgi:hypothetical protein